MYHILDEYAREIIFDPVQWRSFVYEDEGVNGDVSLVTNQSSAWSEK